MLFLTLLTLPILWDEWFLIPEENVDGRTGAVYPGQPVERKRFFGRPREAFLGLRKQILLIWA
jgi:hypothetical protein